MRNTVQVTVAPGTTTDKSPLIEIWYEGPDNVRGEVSLATSVLTFQIDDVDDTTVGTAGVMDMTAAGYNTVTEVIAAINAGTSGHWKARKVGSLNADSTNATVVDQAETVVTYKKGLYLQWDNSEINSHSITAGMEVLNSTGTDALVGSAHADVPASACGTEGSRNAFGTLPEPITGRVGPLSRERQIALNSFKLTPTYTGTGVGTIYFVKGALEITGPTWTPNASTVETEIVFDELGGYPQGLVAPPGYHIVIRLSGTDVSAVASESVTFTYGDPE